MLGGIIKSRSSLSTLLFFHTLLVLGVSKILLRGVGGGHPCSNDDDDDNDDNELYLLRVGTQQ